MRIAIMGTGGVGGYFGGLLAKAGEDVTFIARGEHLKAIQENGLRVKSVHGDFHIQPAKATDDPGTVGSVDLILFATKTHQLEQAAQTIHPLIGPDTVILPLQNGVSSSERLTEILELAEPVLGGTTRIVSLIAAPGLIEHSSQIRQIILGELDGTISGRAQKIGDVLARSGAQVEVTDNINKARWTKFLFIASFSAMGAATRVPIGEMMACEPTRQTFAASMREIKAVAKAQGVALDDDIVESTIAYCDGLEPGITSSMQRDIMAGYPSELEAQVGYIVHKGAELGVPVPVNTFLYSILLPQEIRARRS